MIGWCRYSSEFAKIYDIGNSGVELGLGKTVIDQRSADILISGKLGVETETDVDQCLDAAVDNDGAGEYGAKLPVISFSNASSCRRRFGR